MILSDLALLHFMCASCRLESADGSPPLSTGMIWSTVGLPGWGYFNDLSTGFPHIPHIVWDIRICFLFLSNSDRLGPSLSGLFLVFIALLNKRPPGCFPTGGCYFQAPSPLAEGALFSKQRAAGVIAAPVMRKKCKWIFDDFIIARPMFSRVLSFRRRLSLLQWLSRGVSRACGLRNIRVRRRCPSTASVGFRQCTGAIGASCTPMSAST